MCAAWTWYLANDFQFFLVSPVFLVLAAKMKPLAVFLLCASLAASWMATVYVTDHPGGLFGSNTFDIYYDKPWCRAGPYLIGLATGWIIAAIRSRGPLRSSSQRWLFAFIGWVAAAALNLTLVYGVYHADLSGSLGKLNLSLNRSAWAVGLAWLTTACVSGYGGPVDWVLSLPPLRPLSRLTYAAYLVHPLVILFNYQGREVAMHASLSTLSALYVSHLGLSYAFALLFSLVFEAPYINLQRILGF